MRSESAMQSKPDGAVVAVSASAHHQFSKAVCGQIELIAGLGVRGDAHCGATVRHRSRVKADPTQPNLRQVHLFAAEMLALLADRNFDVAPGALGENITTHGIDLLALPTGTRLQLGEHVVLEVTGLRNPCVQIDRFQAGLLRELLARDVNGELIRKAGMMAVVHCGGWVSAGDAIEAVLPAAPYGALRPV